MDTCSDVKMTCIFSAFMLLTIVAPNCLSQIHTTENDTMESSPPDQRAIISTSMGDIEVELYSSATPVTVHNFVGLAEKGYYAGVLFHRVIKDFMIQAGDPTGTGRGGESLTGKPFADEFVDSLHHERPGILSMANKGPNTNSSQFFITLVPTPWLDHRHTIFGKVVKGMEIVEAIGNVPTDPSSGRPLKDVVINSITVEKPGSTEEQSKKKP